MASDCRRVEALIRSPVRVTQPRRLLRPAGHVAQLVDAEALAVTVQLTDDRSVEVAWMHIAPRSGISGFLVRLGRPARGTELERLRRRDDLEVSLDRSGRPG